MRDRWATELGAALRVAARYQRAFEFPTPEALKKYLHDHPGADPSKHTVKKHDEHEKKPEEAGGKDEKRDHGDEGHHEEKPKTSWKDMVKNLSSKAKEFLKKAPAEVKKFVHDEEYRFKALVTAHKSIVEAPAKFAQNAWHAAKEEGHEFKQAGQGVKAWMDGKPMSKHQKEAFKKVATHVAVAAAAGALGAGLGSGAAVISKGILGSFITSTAKKIAIKAVIKRLEHLPTFEELGHVVHHGTELFSELMDKFAADDKADDADPEEVMKMMILAAVAKELKELDPETVQEALEDAAKAA